MITLTKYEEDILTSEVYLVLARLRMATSTFSDGVVSLLRIRAAKQKLSDFQHF